KTAHQLKDGLKQDRSRILKCGIKDEPSFPKTVHRSVEDKLGTEATFSVLPKDGPSYTPGTPKFELIGIFGT
ncbi:hypothetical protein HAX54_037019, partial [Datura stramonium]|nr:hypothetical protein [Datura stramonium]